MKSLAVVVAESRPGLDALAAARGLTVIENTVRQFDELGYFQEPAAGGNRINIGNSGWVAFGRRT